MSFDKIKFEKAVGKFFVPTVLCIVLAVSVVKVLNFASAKENISQKNELNYGEYIEGYVYNSCKCGKNQLIFVNENDSGKEKFMLYTYNQRDDIKNELEKGAYIRIENPVRFIEKPEAASNWGAFDSKKFLAGQKIKYKIIPDDKSVSIVSKSKNITIIAAEIRNDIYMSLQKALGDEKASIVMAILTGDTSGISSEVITNYRNSGIAHIMAVSGMHVGFVQAVIIKLFSRRRINYAKRNALCIVGLFAFAVIADFSPSVTRAVLQNTYLLGGKVLKRPASKVSALEIACILQLVYNPYLLFNTGFVLSYAAAISILFIQPRISKRFFAFGKIPNFLTTGISVNLGMFPLLVTFFNSFSPIGVIATIFAGKMACAICGLGFGIWLFGSLPFCSFVSKILSALASLAVTGLNVISQAGSGIPPPLGSFKLPGMSFFGILLYYAVLVILIDKKVFGFFRQRIVFTGVAIIIVAVFINVNYRKTIVHFFDVGQGLSVLYKCDGICGLIDAGEGDTDISELLFKEGVGTLDFAVLTHGHSDHTGGFEKVASEHKIKTLIVPGNLVDDGILKAVATAEKYNIKVIYVSEELHCKIGRTQMRFYLNNEITKEASEKNINNASLVMIAKNSDGTAIFTGDIESETENYMAQKGYFQQAEVLQVAHHGSNTGTLDKNISIISPDYAIISVGENNSYGHPANRVVDTLKNAGATVRRSDLCGAIKITLRKGKTQLWQKLKT